MSLVTVAARPHSGTTWLCWILATICDGATPVGGGKKTASTSWRIVRTHSGPEEVKETGIIVLTKRDPRDVLVSYHNRHGMQELGGVVEALCVEWPTMIDRWRPLCDVETSYEELRNNGIEETIRLAKEVFGKTIGEEFALQCLNAYVPRRKPRTVGAWKEDLDPLWVNHIEESMGERMELENYAITNTSQK